MNGYLRSPLNYTGGKYKLLPEILSKVPDHVDTFIDMFCGGLNVAMNVKANRILCIDNLKPLIEMYEEFQATDADTVINIVENIIEDYDLSKTNKDGYLKLRERYNKMPEPYVLFALICHSFNNQIRFNSKGEWNMPFGKDRSSYNDSIKKNLGNMLKFFHSNNISFQCKDFKEFDPKKFTGKDLLYADPPYLISTATYNTGWTEKDDKDLMDKLDELDQHGIKFILSNVLSHKGVENAELVRWAGKYNIEHIYADYSNCSYHLKDAAKKHPSDEVLIMNY